MFSNLMIFSDYEDPISGQILNTIVGDTLLVETIKEFLSSYQSIDSEVLDLIVKVVGCCSEAKQITDDKTHKLLIILKICYSVD
jgi:hypothetical protein